MTKILHAPSDVGDNPWGLSRAERELGVRSDVAVLHTGQRGYHADIDLSAGVDQPFAKRLARRAQFIRKAMREYDVFHFNFGQALFPIRNFGIVFDELGMLKRAGKTILVTFQGCDVRPQACCFCEREACKRNDRYRPRNAQRFLRYADRVFYLNPDLRHWLPGAEFLPYASVDPRVYRPRPFVEREQIVIAHGPTHRRYKGTEHVIAAVEQLRSEALPVTLDLIEGVPHPEAIERTARADVVVDQVMIGWFGAYAVEAMAMAKPTLAYIIDGRPGDNPFGSDLAIERTSPQTLAEDLRVLVGSPERRRQSGERAREFVVRNFDPRDVARKALAGVVDLAPPQERFAEPVQ